MVPLILVKTSQTLPICVPAAFNLVGGGGGAPQKVLGKVIVEEILLRVVAKDGDN